MRSEDSRQGLANFLGTIKPCASVAMPPPFPDGGCSGGIILFRNWSIGGGGGGGGDGVGGIIAC